MLILCGIDNAWWETSITLMLAGKATVLHAESRRFLHHIENDFLMRVVGDSVRREYCWTWLWQSGTGRGYEGWGQPWIHMTMRW